MDPTYNKFAVLSLESDAPARKKRDTRATVFIGNIRDIEAWNGAQREASAIGKITRALLRGSLTHADVCYGLIVMDTHENAAKLIAVIGPDRYTTEFDCDFETARVIRVPCVYAEWARH